MAEYIPLRDYDPDEGIYRDDDGDGDESYEMREDLKTPSGKIRYSKVDKTEETSNLRYSFRVSSLKPPPKSSNKVLVLTPKGL